MKYFFPIFAWISQAVFQGAAATPVIYHHSDSALTGDLLYLQGSGFGSNPAVQYSYNDSIWHAIKAVSAGNGIVTIAMPATETRLPDLLTVRVSADAQTWSAPVIINAPLPLSLDTDQIAPGSQFQLFGRNLTFGRTPTVRLVDIADGSSEAVLVTAANSTHYLLHLTAPGRVVAGHVYQLFVSNGYSGNASLPFEQALSTLVVGRTAGMDNWGLGLPWAADLKFYSNMYNVRTDPRLNILAAGDGVTDDTLAINQALQIAAKAGGGVIYFPSGTYVIKVANGCAIGMLAKTVLQGAGAGSVTIQYGYPVAGPGANAVCFANESGVADVTFTNIDKNHQWQWSGTGSWQNEVFLKRVTWNIGTSQWLTFQSAGHIAIEDSVITQSIDDTFAFLGPLNMEGCAHCVVSHCRISFAVGGMLFDNASDLLFTNNQVIRDISVPEAPQAITHTIAANFVDNLSLLNNTFTSVGGALPTNNDGEVLNTEGGGPTRYDEFRGTVTSSTSTTLTDGAQNFFVSSNAIPNLQEGVATVALVSGNEAGQSRLVTAVSADGMTLTIDHPWDAPPEAGSHYATFDWSARNWIVAGNQLTGNYKGLEIFDASTQNVLIQNNVLTNSDGIMVSPSEAPGMFNVVDNLEISGNVIDDTLGLRPAYVGLIPREDSQMSSFGTHIVGARVAANTIIGFVPNVFNSPSSWDDYKVTSEGYLGTYYWQSLSNYSSGIASPLLGSLFQSNTAINSAAAYSLNSGAVQTTIDQPFAPQISLLQDVAINGAETGSQETVIKNSFKMTLIGSASSDMVTRTISPFGERTLTLEHQAFQSPALSGSLDSLAMFSQQVSTDENIRARVNNDSPGLGVVLIRNSSSPTSPFVAIGLDSGNLIVISRSSTGAPAKTLVIPWTSPTAWLGLEKAGPLVLAMYSADGVSWQQIVSNVSFTGSTYLAGVADLGIGARDVDTSFNSLCLTPLLASRLSVP